MICWAPGRRSIKSERVGANPLAVPCTTAMSARYTWSFAQVSNMYAIVQAGGKQLKVTPGGYATLEGTAGEPGAELALEQVLLIEKDGGDIVAGSPFVANARVLAIVEGETRGPKIRVFKKKRRKGMRRTKGHRATFTRVQIKEIIL